LVKCRIFEGHRYSLLLELYGEGESCSRSAATVIVRSHTHHVSKTAHIASYLFRRQIEWFKKAGKVVHNRYGSLSVGFHRPPL
jgi:hypothetical protein